MYKDMDNTKEYIRVSEAAKMLSVSIGTVHNWRRKGYLSYTRLPSGKILYDKSFIENYYASKQ